MSLKAIQHSQYKKNGKTILTYKVSGTVAELQRYVETQAANFGITPEEWMRSEDKDKAPLFFLNANNEIRFGRMPKGTYNLDFKRDGTGVFINTQSDDIARWHRIAEKQEDAMAKIAAEREMGINTVAAPTTTNPNTPVTTPASPAEQMLKELETPVAEVAAGTEDLEA